MDQEMQMDPYFMQLVLSLQMGTIQHLGKIVSPVSGKVERDLEMARHSIQMLEMIHKKTANSLSDEERRLIEGVLYDLRLNYVDEVARKEEPAEGHSDTPGETGAGSAGESGNPEN